MKIKYNVKQMLVKTDETPMEVRFGDEILKVRAIYLYDGSVQVWNNSPKLPFVYHKMSEVQFATPLSHNNARICIGDDIKFGNDWYKVLDYVFYKEKWCVVIHRSDFSYSWLLTEDEVLDHRINLK